MERLITKFICVLACTVQMANAQEKLFYDTRIINGHSVETSNQGMMKFIISHRFGTLNSGAYNLFGLDNSTIRMGLDYGVNRLFTIGIGRSSYEKTYDGYAKMRLLTQGMHNAPLSITALAGLAIKGLKFTDTSRVNYFSHRLSYNYSIMFARRFNDRLSFQLAPTLIHRNIVPSEDISNDVYLINIAGRFLASKKVSLNFEYCYALPDQLASEFTNCLSLGLDIETKGHVFQFQLSNSRGMVDKLFMTETSGKWTKGDIHYGFNITRDFKIRGRKY